MKTFIMYMVYAAALGYAAMQILNTAMASLPVALQEGLACPKDVLKQLVQTLFWLLYCQAFAQLEWPLWPHTLSTDKEHIMQAKQGFGPVRRGSSPCADEPDDSVDSEVLYVYRN